MEKTKYTEGNLKEQLIEVINLSRGPNDLNKNTNAKIASSLYLSKSIIESSDELIESNSELIESLNEISKNNNKVLESENTKQIMAEKENIDKLISSNTELAESNEKYSNKMFWLGVSMALLAVGQIVVGIIPLFASSP